VCSCAISLIPAYLGSLEPVSLPSRVLRYWAEILGGGVGSASQNSRAVRSFPTIGLGRCRSRRGGVVFRIKPCLLLSASRTHHGGYVVTVLSLRPGCNNVWPTEGR
jgi:hypothetical protein